MNPCSVSDVAAQLRHRLPLPTDQRYDVVLENDLVGRAALAILWQYRSQLSICLIASDPPDRNVVALQSALSTVRNPPAVQIISPNAAQELTRTVEWLVWAVLPERTDTATQTMLQQRHDETTHLPYVEPIAALQDQHPDQTDPAHELILRDIIGQRAPFLNFFGDRFNPQDLYERAKYPRWFRPPPDFSAAIPAVEYSTVALDGAVVETGQFTGSLQLATPYVQAGYRSQVEFAPVLESLEQPIYDVTVHLHGEYVNSDAAGALAIEIHDDYGIYDNFDIATAPTHLEVPIRAVHPGATLTICVVAQRDNPRTSWSAASTTTVRLEIHPSGTLPAPSIKTRAKSWLRRMRRRQRRDE